MTKLKINAIVLQQLNVIVNITFNNLKVISEQNKKANWQ